MMKLLSISCLSLLLFMPGIRNKLAKSTTTIPEIILEKGASLLEKGDLNGLSIGVYQAGKVYKLHLGNLKKEMLSSPTDETVYEIASLTKTFAGTLLAKAIVDGRVGINDDIRAYLSGDYPNLSYSGQAITFAHLVTHNSRLPFLFPHTPNLFEEQDQLKITKRINQLTEGLTKKKFFEELANYELDTLPGSGFAYSNVGANLLGYCLESIYQKEFEVLLAAFITKPLGMNQTSIHLTAQTANLLAKGYTNTGVPMPLFAEKEMSADGGLKSTLPDMLKYMAFHLDEREPIVKMAHSELLDGKFGGFENGVFWQMFKSEDGERKIFQNGGAPGTSSWMTFIPERKTGIFIVTNTSGPDVHQRLSETVDKILEGIAAL